MKSTSPNRDPIADRLREEATADAPPFSPLLHARIMQQIEKRSVTVPNPPAHWRIQWLAPTLATAAMAAVVAALWLHNQPAHPRIGVVMPARTLPEFTLHFPDLAETANAPLTQAPYANLDRDAKNVVNYMINQLDVIPAQPSAPRG